MGRAAVAEGPAATAGGARQVEGLLPRCFCTPHAFSRDPYRWTCWAVKCGIESSNHLAPKTRHGWILGDWMLRYAVLVDG